jgi:hypothetical protein
MRLASLATLVLAAAALGAPAHAAPDQGRFLHPADSDHDERLSRAEWLAAGGDEESFEKADANEDGVISGPEFAAWFMAKEGIAPAQTASAEKPPPAVDRLVERR